MLESNLKMLQEEFKRQKISDQAKASDSTESGGYVSLSGNSHKLLEEATSDNSNPFSSDSGDEYDASGKNPFTD